MIDDSPKRDKRKRLILRKTSIWRGERIKSSERSSEKKQVKV